MIALPPRPDLDLASLVRTIPDFPKPGIQFRDITTLIGDAGGFSESVRRLAERAAAHHPDYIVAVEARGFLFGAAMATAMGVGLVPVRKAGKLPGVTIGVDYELEYGVDRLELHEGAVTTGHRVVLVDDLLATGGTILAAAQLMRNVGAEVAAALFVIDLPDLGGSQRLAAAGLVCETLIAFDGD
ncbi:adenine phosphoribosyltransferase [Sphingopyxis sp. H050]|jgi:adenine phosphoribosyltransferase|uniref:adenine phosphoribosyltransferase n=1 Tax=Sphingopyxis sp. H050 TaxID=1759072 RepID=UPI0007367238|nr:adenine phosphoribosyltransferase [Sphingopyxis sp. H050]KTE21891.1 adenine phosphoribosyltransferase [Sphingopyxis sp. H050]